MNCRTSSLSPSLPSASPDVPNEFLSYFQDTDRSQLQVATMSFQLFKYVLHSRTLRRQAVSYAIKALGGSTFCWCDPVRAVRSHSFAFAGAVAPAGLPVMLMTLPQSNMVVQYTNLPIPQQMQQGTPCGFSHCAGFPLFFPCLDTGSVSASSTI